MSETQAWEHINALTACVKQLQQETTALQKHCAILDENCTALNKALEERDQVTKDIVGAISEIRTELRENPLQKHLDVWNFEMTYHKNNSVTYQGSTWLCKAQSTKDVPGGPEQSWVLTAKRGRDGKDAKHYAVA